MRSERSEQGGLRLLIVANTDQRRGAEVLAERLRDGLTGLGWVVDAVSLTTMRRATKAKVDPLTNMTPEEAGRFAPKIVTALRRRIESFDPDVVLATGGSTLRYGVLANIGLSSRLVYLGIGEPKYWIRSRRSAFLNRMLLRRVHRVLAVSAQTRAELIELEPSIEARAEVTYTGVPDAMFRTPGPRREGPLRVVMVGSLSTEKDPGLALRAVAAVDGARLRFVGEGPLEGHLRQEVARLGIGPRVEFVGSVDDVAPHLSWADVLVLTSKTEGLPAAILEAAAGGVPAVSVDVGGVREAIRDGVTGVVVPIGDTGALTNALESLTVDPERLAQMGRDAAEHVRERFNMDLTLSRFADVLTAAAG